LDTWLWLLLASNAVYWSIFFFFLVQRRWTWGALLVGVGHMLFASPLVIAPFRAVIESQQFAYAIGFIRFEGLAAALPAALVLAWALASAWIAVSRGAGRWMAVIAGGDGLMALNLGVYLAVMTVQGGLVEGRMQAGEFSTLTDPVTVALVLMLVLAVPFAGSALWAARLVPTN
jgi:hypothetical protein